MLAGVHSSIISAESLLRPYRAPPRQQRDAVAAECRAMLEECIGRLQQAPPPERLARDVRGVVRDIIQQARSAAWQIGRVTGKKGSLSGFAISCQPGCGKAASWSVDSHRMIRVMQRV